MRSVPRKDFALHAALFQARLPFAAGIAGSRDVVAAFRAFFSTPPAVLIDVVVFLSFVCFVFVFVYHSDNRVR